MITDNRVCAPLHEAFGAFYFVCCPDMNGHSGLMDRLYIRFAADEVPVWVNRIDLQ